MAEPRNPEPARHRDERSPVATSSAIRSPSQPAMSLSNILNTNGSAAPSTSTNGMRAPEPHPSPSARSVTSISSLLDDGGSYRNGGPGAPSPNANLLQLPPAGVTPSRSPSSSMQPPSATPPIQFQRAPTSGPQATAHAPRSSSSKTRKSSAKDTDASFRAKNRPIAAHTPGGSSSNATPSSLKRRRESASKSGWASDLSDEDNRRMWEDSLEDYAEGLQLRRACIDAAYMQQESVQSSYTALRVSRAYQRRYAAVLRKADERKQQEEERVRMAEVAKAEKAKQRQSAQEKRQSSVATSSTSAKAKTNDSRKRIKPDVSSPPPSAAMTDFSVDDSRQGSEDIEDAPIVGSSKSGKAPESVDSQFEKVWAQIARKDIPQAQRLMVASATNKQMYWRRHSVVAQREGKRGVLRSVKTGKDVNLRSRKVMREMLVFWKRNEKEERESRKRAEKEALDKAKKEEDLREAKRQARKLNFLISQTELFSHFVGSKLKTSEAEDSADTAGDSKSKITELPDQASSAVTPVPDVATNGELQALDFDEEDDTNLRAHAARKAQEAVLAAKQKAQDFDSAAAEERKTLQAAAAAGEEGALGKVFDSDDLNFNNPTSMGEMDLRQPKMLTVTLKDYQLKGLNWLANLYEQGINGILADEMGLGKTIQSISLMAYLAEVHDIWGPFLVIAPASTLHNWQQEISRFVPHLKPLPYWGSVKDRAVLRKFWNRKQMSYTRDAPFHILVTSYQLVVTDEKYFQRVKWQYMILDEAQAIKSSSSNRWKTLLGFQCRNRLLLTGTPVQNSMQELWALLHFIMPSLFDSHDEFSEWFSKDIESHAENKGTLNEHQLRRLHMILKPFMLRRIKKNVQNELGDKIEIDLFCDLSARQRMLYRALRSHVSVAEIMDKVGNINDEAGLKHLMNLVMQFRKVCNHPELFERADVRSPFAFAGFAQSGSLTREGDIIECPDSMRSRIEFRVPKLMVRDGGIFSIPGESSRKGFETHYLDNLMNIWRADYVHRSIQQDGQSAFGFLSLLDMNAADAQLSFHGTAALRALYHAGREEKLRSHRNLIFDDEYAVSALRPRGIVRKALPSNSYQAPSILLSFDEVTEDYRTHSYFSKPGARTCFPAAVAPPVSLYANDGPFVDSQESLKRDAFVSQALFGLTPQAREEEDAVERLQRALPGIPPVGLLAASSRDQLPASGMAVPQMNKLVVDSSKLARLDTLLRELKAGGHRVLIYFQMTRMIDLMEEYLIYRQYKYLRLDGSSKISDRRDMVTDWQTKPELFIFLLSTRAGGLGINLTAADTVIFYDHDWNPSNDSQAMDRAHRLGQTKQVTVYRLITKSTIDERIVKLARNKKEVQDIVVGNKAYTETGMARPQEIVSLLLDDDELAASMLRRKQAEEAQLAQGKADQARASHIKRRANRDKANAAANAPAVSLSWALEDDEDDFFGAKPPLKEEDGEGATAAAPKKKKAAPKKKAPVTPATPILDDNGDPLPPRPTKKGRKKTMDELAGTAT